MDRAALDLAPDPADRVLADRAAKQGRKRAAHPTCVGAGQVGARDQGVGNKQHQGDDLHTASEAFIDDFRQRTRR